MKTRKVKLARLKRDVRKAASRARAKVSQWFFKTGPGEYGEGDRFLGVNVPALRRLARQYQDLPIGAVRQLLQSRWHEERLLALLILTRQYAAGDERRRAAIYRFYLRNTRRINNWDLVDVSADRIVGAHLGRRSRKRIRQLARSDMLWERRIAMVATFHYIRQGDFLDALSVAEMLLDDPHDLIHKAVGWMLREIGKRDRPAEERFLKKHAAVMPRTMLRYAIERFPPRLRQRYLEKRAPTRDSPERDLLTKRA